MVLRVALRPKQMRIREEGNQSIYYSKFGILKLIKKSGDECGREWLQRADKLSPPGPLRRFTFAVQLLLVSEWQKRLEQTAESVNIDRTIRITNSIDTNLFPRYEGFPYKSKQQPQYFGNKQKNGLDIALATSEKIYDSTSRHEYWVAEQPSERGLY